MFINGRLISNDCHMIVENKTQYKQFGIIKIDTKRGVRVKMP